VKIEPRVFRDGRGFFVETYQAGRYAAAGIEDNFIQDNHSKSTRGVLRGLHAQLRKPQAKLIRVIQGEVFDVAVDIRRQSPTFGNWVSFTLTADNFLQAYVPIGFAHGFCVLSETAEFEYKVTDAYDPDGELHLLWNDPDIGIEWPITDPILSAKDQHGVRLKDIAPSLPF
jgi:dTDP-4-dehydrorhamnose 3,5-epimerase